MRHNATLRDLATAPPTRATPTRRQRDAWFEDPDLAPPPRREVPLTAFA